jgi:hypothetical protein
MIKTNNFDENHKKLSGFYRFLKIHYRFSECRIRGIIACTGVVLNKVQDLTISRSDLEKIRHYIKEIGLSGETINFYLTSFVLYIIYLENDRSGGMSTTE